MNWGGIVAGGVANGAGQVVDIAAKGLDTDRRLDAARVLADIEEQKQMRLAEFGQRMARDQQTYNTSGQGGQELLAFEATRGRQGNAVALEGRRADATDADITAGLAGRAGAVAQATGEVQTAQDIKRATAMLPLEIKKAYAVADAAAKAHYAHEKAPGAELAAKVKIVQDTIGRELTEQEKLGIFGLAKGANESDKETVKETTFGKDGSVVERTRTETRRAGGAGGQGRETETEAHAAAADAIKRGAPMDAVNKRLTDAGYAPLPAADKAPVRGIVGAQVDKRVPDKAAATYTGLEGLSRLALQRVANDPTNPRSALARQMLADADKGRLDDIQSSMDAAEQYWPQ